MMLILLSLIGLCTADDGRFPDCSVTAEVGETVILLVKVDSPEDSELLQPIISWKNEDGVVHHYLINRDDNRYQLKRFKGRTSLFKEEIMKGNISLKIINVNERDEGKYTCEVSYEESVVEIETYSGYLCVTKKKHQVKDAVSRHFTRVLHPVEDSRILILGFYAAFILCLVYVVARTLAAGNTAAAVTLLFAFVVIGRLIELMDPELKSL